MKKYTFAYRVFLLNLILFIIPFLLYFLLFFYWEYQSKVDSVLFNLEDLSHTRAALLSETVAASQVLLDLVAQDFKEESLHFLKNVSFTKERERKPLELKYENTHFFMLLRKEISNGTLEMQIPLDPLLFPPSKSLHITLLPEKNITFARSTVAVTVPVEGTPFQLLLQESKSLILESLLVDLQKEILFFILIFTGVIFLNVLVVRRLSKPLDDVSATMDTIGQGDYSARYKRDRYGFEINKIGQILNEMTEHLVHSIDHAREEKLKKEIMAKELTIGKNIQQTILPQEMPKLEGIKLIGRTLPAYEVAGDFFDAFLTSDQQKLIVAVGDTSGKGISACLYSFVLRSMIRSFAFESHSISDVVILSNNLFCKDTFKTSYFVSLFLLSFDPKTKVMEYVSSENPPVFIVHEDGNLTTLPSEGIALGVKPFTSIEKKSIQLKSKDIVFLYTDGLFMAMHEEKLKQFLLENRLLPLEELSKELESLQNNRDDITFIIMKIE